MIIYAAISILSLSILSSLVKMTVTKTTVDRVIVIDILSFQVLALCILLSIYEGDPTPLIFGLLVAMLGFLSTVILSRFINISKS